MKDKKASFTATLMAYYRAYHTRHDAPRIFDDFLAHHLFTEDEHSFFENGCAQAPKLYDSEGAASLSFSWGETGIRNRRYCLF